MQINFSGGEPFIHATHLGEMVRFCKQELQIESVSIVSNGSMITDDWFRKYARYLDILAISCDSFEHETNLRTGRHERRQDPRPQRAVLETIERLCREHDVKFKINTVVTAFNVDEDMSMAIMELAPCRWKVFQVLPLEGENYGEGANRDVEKFLITSDQYEGFVARHRHTGVLVAESNDTMRNSYLILNEDMCFLDCTAGDKRPSPSILDVSVEAALLKAGFDADMFHKREGVYDWTKETPDDDGDDGDADDRAVPMMVDPASSPAGVGRRSRPLAAAVHVVPPTLDF